MTRLIAAIFPCSASYPYDASSVADLIGVADRALMFKAKQSGKNSIFLVGEQPPVEPA